jgi:hypothetical protein
VPPADHETGNVSAVDPQSRVEVADNGPAAGQGPGAVDDTPASDGDTFLNRQAAQRFQTSIVVARHNGQLNSHISQADMEAAGHLESLAIFDKVARHHHSQNLVSRLEPPEDRKGLIQLGWRDGLSSASPCFGVAQMHIRHDGCRRGEVHEGPFRR